MRTLTVLTLWALAAAPGFAADIRAAGPAAEGPPELSQYGQFVGAWKCRSYSRVRDGSWQPNDWENSWTWHWVLEGHAIQDIWEVPPESPRGRSVGTNLRIYDPGSGTWRMAWTTTSTRAFDLFEARERDDDLVMTGEIPARGSRPPHSARITFHDIGPDSFQWRYEASLEGQSGPFSEQARLNCRRVDAG